VTSAGYVTPGQSKIFLLFTKLALIELLAISQSAFPPTYDGSALNQALSP
jgi:hypothetical protein